MAMNKKIIYYYLFYYQKQKMTHSNDLLFTHTQQRYVYGLHNSIYRIHIQKYSLYSQNFNHLYNFKT